MGLKIITVVFLIVMAIFIILDDLFQKNKEKEYQNDERWNMIKLKTYQQVFKFYNYLVCGLGIFWILSTFSDSFNLNLNWDLYQVMYFLIFLSMLRYPLEYFTLKHYDNIL